MTSFHTFENPSEPDPPGESNSAGRKPDFDRRGSMLGRFGWSLFVLFVLGGGALLAWFLAVTGPEARRTDGPDERQARVVDLVTVRTGDHPVVIQAHGTVEAARRVTVVPRVAGEIVELADSFRPGGEFQAGEFMAQVDPSDYRLAVDQRRSELEQARADLQLEEGNRAVAREEYEKIKDRVDVADLDLVLREPQYRSAKASVDRAKSALETARLNLRRTTIKAPFDAHLTEQFVDLGTSVSVGQNLATLVGTDEYWVRVSLPVSRLHWIRTAGEGADTGVPVRIHNRNAWGEGAYREGFVKDVVEELESRGRMAQVLVAVPDPLARQPANAGVPTLMVGSYVRGEIRAGILEDSVRLDRGLVREEDTVWVMDEEGRLDVRTVEIAYRGVDTVLVEEGLESGDRVVRTSLEVAVDGMPLRVRGNGDTGPRPTPNEPPAAAMSPANRAGE